MKFIAPNVLHKIPHNAQVHMHADAIRQLLYGCAYVREDNPLAEARGLSSLT